MTDIIVSNISKYYDGKVVFRNLSLSFPAGKITCIKGPSGCGKTTLMRIVAGLEQASEGSVSGVPDKIGFVFQENRLCEDFTALRNIRLVTGKRMENEEILRHLQEVGLSEDLTKPVRAFSGGMKRRVAIARAICYGAPLLILDEPFKGLDEKLRSRVMDYVKQYSAGKTVLCVTHDSAEAEYLGGFTADMGNQAEHMGGLAADMGNQAEHTDGSTADMGNEVE